MFLISHLRLVPRQCVPGLLQTRPILNISVAAVKRGLMRAFHDYGLKFRANKRAVEASLTRQAWGQGQLGRDSLSFQPSCLILKATVNHRLKKHSAYSAGTLSYLSLCQRWLEESKRFSHWWPEATEATRVRWRCQSKVWKSPRLRPSPVPSAQVPALVCLCCSQYIVRVRVRLGLGTLKDL